MRKPVIPPFRFLKNSITPEKGRMIERYINFYHTLLHRGGDISVDHLENIHGATLSSLHPGAATNEIMISAFLYAALRLPECMDRVSRVIIVPGDAVLMGCDCEDVGSWEPARAHARRRRALFDGNNTLAVLISSVSDIDDLIPALCAYQIEWNKMHKRLKISSDEQCLKDGFASVSEVKNTLKTVLRISSADYEMMINVWGDQWIKTVAAIASAPKHFSVRMYSSDRDVYKEEVQRWWHNLLNHFRDTGIEGRPLYLVSSNTHSLANIISGFARRYRHDLVTYALENDREGLHRQWDWLRDEEEEAKLNFYYYAQRGFVEKEKELGTIQKEMEERAGLQRFRHGQFSDQETQVIDLSQIRSDTIDTRLERRNLELLKKSRALILNIDYPLGLSAYYIMSQIVRGAHDLRGVYIMGKSAAMIGRLGDIMIPSEIRDNHTHNRYLFANCFSVRDLVGYLRNIAVFDDQRSMTVRGTFLHSRDSIRKMRKDDFTGIEMEAGPYLSALYEYIHGSPAPRGRRVRIVPNRSLDIGILHYTSDVPYNLRASLLSRRLGYIGMEATYACTLAILQSIVHREAKILETE